uniref:Solute carrier family 35 member G1 n=1 Tax=Equus caballus TaxID=9796 RepID=A0A9L0TFB6_HORSE
MRPAAAAAAGRAEQPSSCCRRQTPRRPRRERWPQDAAPGRYRGRRAAGGRARADGRCAPGRERGACGRRGSGDGRSRQVLAVPLLAVRLVRAAGSGFLGPKGQRIFLVLRGFLGSASMMFAYYAFQTTSLADATVISFTCPVFTSIFACIFLKEKYSPWDALFTAFTIVGVILIVRPPFLFGSDTMEINESYSVHLKGTFAAIGHAVFAAMTLVILRKMGKSVDYFLSIWYYVALGLIEGIIVLFILGEWSLPYCGLDRLYLILIGLFGLGGQVFLTKGIQIEKAGPVAIMRTMDVVFAFIFQIIFFNDVPTWWTVGGALCVVASSTGAAIRKWCQSSK